MGLHVLDDDVVEAFVLAAACLHADPEDKALEVLKNENTDECEAEDDEDEHDVENHEHDR